MASRTTRGIRTAAEAAGATRLLDAEAVAEQLEAAWVMRIEPGRLAACTFRHPHGHRGNHMSLKAQRAEDGSVSIQRQTPAYEGSSPRGPGRPERLPGPPDGRNEGRDGDPLGLRDTAESAARDQIGRMAARAADIGWAARPIALCRQAAGEWLRGLPIDLRERCTLARRRREMEEAVRSLVDPDCWSLCDPDATQMPLRHYNHAARSADAYRKAMTHNPGAATLVLRTMTRRAHSEDTVYQHPGQLISQARAELDRMGVDRRHWRLITRMDPAVIRVLTAKGTNDPIRSVVFGACGRLGIQPTVEQARRMVRLLSELRRVGSQRLRYDQMETAERSAHQLAAALLRGGHEPDTDQINDLVDHAVGLAQEGRAVESRTIGGALRRAEERQRANAIRRRAEADRSAISRNGDDPPAWEFLIDEQEQYGRNPTEPLRVVPIRDANELAAEGIVMAHCAADYTADCLAGVSRVFSIRRGERTIATTELQLRRGRWRVRQTRGYRNGPAGPAAREAAQATARLYQKAWENINARTRSPN